MVEMLVSVLLLVFVLTIVVVVVLTVTWIVTPSSTVSYVFVFISTVGSESNVFVVVGPWSTG